MFRHKYWIVVRHYTSYRSFSSSHTFGVPWW